MTKLSTKKCLLMCLVISLVLIVAGAFLFGFLGFNTDSTTQDYTSVEVADNGYMATDSAFRSSLEELCLGEIEGKYAVGNVSYSDFAGTDPHLEFILSEIVGDEEMGTFVEGLESTLSTETYGDTGRTYGEIADISVTYHNAVYAAHYEQVWRAAIAAAVVLVLLFAYVAIRFKVGMGVTSLIAAVHDVLLTLAVVALCRISAGAPLVCVAVFAMLFSMFLNLKVFGKMRKDFRLDERKDLSAKDAIELSVRESRKGVFIASILAAAAIVVLAVVGIIAGFDLFSFMIAALVAVIACTYSSLVLSPTIYTLIKEKSDAARARKARYDYSSEKANKKNAKVEGNRPEESAGNA